MTNMLPDTPPVAPRRRALDLLIVWLVEIVAIVFSISSRICWIASTSARPLGFFRSFVVRRHRLTLYGLAVGIRWTSASSSGRWTETPRSAIS